MGTGLVDANGDVVISFPALDSLTDIVVVGTNYNYRPYQGSVKVLEPGVSVVPTFSVYPNPISSNESLSLSFNLNEDTDVVITILNSLGQLVDQLEYDGLLAGSHQQTIPIDGYRKGIYKLYAIIDGEKVVTKFMVK